MIITIEGNIGAGKTTFAKSLYATMKKRGYRVVYIPEPVDSWTNFHGCNLLDMMYGDLKRWSFTFQINALLHMTRCDEQALNYVDHGFIVVRERSSSSTRNMFAPLLFEYMEEAEKRILEDLFATIKDPCSTRHCKSCHHSDITVYMRTDPERCYQRVQKRHRPEESNGRVDLAYLVKLHEMHERTMPKVTDSGCRLIVANGNEFDIDDPKTVKIHGCDDSVYGAINASSGALQEVGETAENDKIYFV